jgi:hypothetical protein
MSELFNDHFDSMDTTTDTTALMKDRDSYEYSVSQLSEIVKMDNHYKHENSNAIISSTIIIEKFGGV